MYELWNMASRNSSVVIYCEVHFSWLIGYGMCDSIYTNFVSGETDMNPTVVHPKTMNIISMV